MSAEEVREEKPKAEFDFADWLAEGVRGLRQEIKAMKAKRCALLPEAFWEHARASQREALLAFRSLVDALIECVQPKETEGEPEQSRRQRVTKIEVQ
ncbi:MAG: hypothetical protein RML36_04715 [Anaerolineae bacterium]|nr:hypothetical protein [Anaerolineae bacterium]MDW8098775.1 hypothetical protein [Anaerolineae bacterium]